jgi:hypothetical protein
MTYPLPSTGVLVPLLLPFTSVVGSRASALRFRNSARFTRPTVCDLRRSSAVVAWEVKPRGVEVPDDGAEGSMMTEFSDEADKVGRKERDSERKFGS